VCVCIHSMAHTHTPACLACPLGREQHTLSFGAGSIHCSRYLRTRVNAGAALRCMVFRARRFWPQARRAGACLKVDRMSVQPEAGAEVGGGRRAHVPGSSDTTGRRSSDCWTSRSPYFSFSREHRKFHFGRESSSASPRRLSTAGSRASQANKRRGEESCHSGEALGKKARGRARSATAVAGKEDAAAAARGCSYECGSIMQH
jgi:hypothetical protein